MGDIMPNARIIKSLGIPFDDLLMGGIGTMDKVVGWSAKKGIFEILTYRNRAGEILKRVSNFV